MLSAGPLPQQESSYLVGTSHMQTWAHLPFSVMCLSCYVLCTRCQNSPTQCTEVVGNSHCLLPQENAALVTSVVEVVKRVLPPAMITRSLCLLWLDVQPGTDNCCTQGSSHPPQTRSIFIFAATASATIVCNLPGVALEGMMSSGIMLAPAQAPSCLRHMLP